VFSLVKSQWSDERNRLSVNCVQAISQVKVNFVLSCKQMYEKLLSDGAAQRAILSGKNIPGIIDEETFE
jgi:hypothetical protein